MRLHDVADTLLRVQEELLLARRRRRRAPGRRPARHPVLRDEPRARVRRRRPAAVPRRLSRRPDAEPVRRLQHLREVRGAARPGAAPLRLRGGRDRPLRAARRRRRTGGRACCRARDEDKDQTYFLYGLRQDQLEHARFPLGELTKPEVRAVARALGLATADKPESQEICFVPGGDYREALRDRAGWQPTAGPARSTPTASGSGSTAASAALHRRPAPGPRASRSARRATSAGSIR